MEGKLSLEIKNFRSINEANIEINKINVIGGVNGSGKSTVSKVFYSFLKGNSLNGRVYYIQKIINEINESIEYLIDRNFCEKNALEFLSAEDDYSEMMEKYEKALEIFNKHAGIIENQEKEYAQRLLNITNEIIDKLKDEGIDVSHFQYNSDEKECHPKYGVLLRFLNKNNYDDEFNKLFDILSEDSNYDFDFKKKKIKQSYSLIEDYFIHEDNPELSEKITNFIFKDERFGVFSHNSTEDFNQIVNLFVKSNKKQDIDAFEYFFNNEFVKNVFYVDNVSILDLEEKNSKFKAFHMSEIINELYSEDMDIYDADEIIIDDDIEMILEKIEDIVQGQYAFEGYLFKTKIPSNEYVVGISIPNSDNNDISTIGVMIDSLSSGIKQIGTIELLLRNNKLEKDCFLIIDEPEVNLHPTWQFKFAEILVLLAKKLNITVYLNSHSPTFIESIDAFASFYDISDSVNYYLTQESEMDGRYDFIKIDSNELYKIYENLGDVYKLIDQLRIRKRLGQ